MGLAKTVALATVLLMLLISMGYVFAQGRPPGKAAQECVIKPVMTDAEIELCRRAAYRK
jgi:hypothetical protein